MKYIYLEKNGEKESILIDYDAGLNYRFNLFGFNLFFKGCLIYGVISFLYSAFTWIFLSIFTISYDEIVEKFVTRRIEKGRMVKLLKNGWKIQNIKNPSVCKLIKSWNLNKYIEGFDELKSDKEHLKIGKIKSSNLTMLFLLIVAYNIFLFFFKFFEASTVFVKVFSAIYFLCFLRYFLTEFLKSKTAQKNLKILTKIVITYLLFYLSFNLYSGSNEFVFSLITYLRLFSAMLSMLFFLVLINKK